MSNFNKIRCTNKEHNCFAYNHGICEALSIHCNDKNDNCKFYKTKDVYIEELKICAERLNMSFSEYLEVTGIKI